MAISDNLFSTIKDDILTGKLKSGEKLTEKVICNQYNISRTPVREALQKLEMEGLVESIPNRGFFVYYRHILAFVDKMKVNLREFYYVMPCISSDESSYLS